MGCFPMRLAKKRWQKVKISWNWTDVECPIIFQNSWNYNLIFLCLITHVHAMSNLIPFRFLNGFCLVRENWRLSSKYMLNVFPTYLPISRLNLYLLLFMRIKQMKKKTKSPKITLCTGIILFVHMIWEKYCC